MITLRNQNIATLHNVTTTDCFGIGEVSIPIDVDMSKPHSPVAGKKPV